MCGRQQGRRFRFSNASCPKSPQNHRHLITHYWTFHCTPKTANSTSAAHQLVTGAGLVNLYADNETQYPERNLEDVITKNPDIIVKLCGSSTALDEATYDAYVAELAGVTAADEGKVILLNNECGTTAIGSIIGRLYIAKFAYPELFADVDVDAVYAELYANFLGAELSGSGAFTK